MSKIKVAIIDSGVYTEHSIFKNVDSIVVHKSSNLQNKVVNGHGTAIYNIISAVNNIADIINFDICDEKGEIDESSLCDCLENILYNHDVNVINISMGINICHDIDRLQYLCNQLFDKGVIIVSAFDNTGSISYPAAFENVIGVTEMIECRRIYDFVYFEDKIVNIGAKGGLQRVAWANPPYIMMSGNSFACAHATVQIVRFMEIGIKYFEDILNKFKEIAILDTQINDINMSHNQTLSIKKAVLFPFNKEMHALIRFESLLDFEIVGIYDSKYSSNVGSNTNHILKGGGASHDILNVDKIDWDSFDTLIIGHFDTLAFLTDEYLPNHLISEAICREKNIYSYGDIYMKYNYSKLYCPVIDNHQLPPLRLGKLFRIPKPVLGIFGTSSAQGKFTLQLELRKRFLEKGYKIGQIGTEPNSLLFGMDYIFPMGYGNSVYINGHDTIRYLNCCINELCVNKDCDIIVLGSQSSVIPYDVGNIGMFPVRQYDFLMGAQPDAVVLCVNPFDDIKYIQRTISFIESSTDCKVLAISMFPMDVKNDWSALYGQKEVLSQEKYLMLKNLLIEKFNIPVYILGNNNEVDSLFDKIITYFEE